MTTSIHRQYLQGLDRLSLQQYQLDRLNQLLSEVMPHNAYYQSKFQDLPTQLQSLEEWAAYPTSSKSDWLGSTNDGLAVHHTFAESSYRRYHRTSGTRGRPMVVLDTQKDWQWWIDTWQYVLDACRIEPSDRIMMAFSFGPFIGFWSAHDACLQRGCMVIPCGGMSTAARIDFIQSAKPSVLFSTPTYAMHMANDASKRGIDLRSSSIRQVFVAGEPGGCVPAIRKRIEDAYGAKLMDHAGATEVGPWGVGTADGTSLHVIESEFIAEYLPTKSNPRNLRSPAETEPDAVFELVITSLGRVGAPVLRYRTGDLVRPYESKDPECRFMCLAGGVLGRADDMFVVRGVNVFPSSVDSIVRTFDSVFEYRLIVDRIEDMDQLMLQIELDSKADDPHVVETRLAERLAIQLNLRIDVRSVPPGTLAPGEGKAKRFIDRRKLTAG